MEKKCNFSIALDVLNILNDDEISKIDKSILCIMLYRISYSFVINNLIDTDDKI